MNTERRSLSEELKETQRVRGEYRPLRMANLWGKVIEKSTDSKVKSIGGAAVTMGFVALSMIADSNVAIATAETLAVLGGATIGEKIPLFSGPIGFMKEKKAVRIVRQEKDVSSGEIADLLHEFSDVVAEKEVELWPKKQLGEESLEHPDRYRIMRAVLNNNPETPGVVVEKFMEAQRLAQENRRSKKYMRKEALRKAGDVAIGVVVMAGITNLVSFGFGYQSQVGIVGLADDAILIGVLTYSYFRQKIKSFLSKTG
jgi:hypothetical protein